MTEKLLLLPMPRHIEHLTGSCSLTGERLILLDAPNPQGLRFAAARLQQALRSTLDLNWETAAGQFVPTESVGITLRIAPGKVTRPQGYDLLIGPDAIRIEGHDEAGVLYGVCTLIQILQSSIQKNKPKLPCLRILDWPDFPARGVMLDISRDKVPTLATAFDLVDRLAGWKVNQFQLYTEHTFAYRNHPDAWATASPFTAEDILALDAFCRERHVELVPNQNSFGHMNRWLTQPRYHPLAECPDGYTLPWGWHSDDPFTLCPSDPGSLALIRDLYDELLPNFTSRMFNVGCDETWDLGQGRSKAECERRGSGRVYLEFLLKIYREATARGRQVQFWGDIILKHPELVGELPKDIIALEWGYEANHPFGEHGAQFGAAGLQFYVCPGTSSWNSVAGRTDNAVGNLLSAAENGLKYGATGYLNTDWGDNGHWQPLPVSYLGYAAGAAYSWALEPNRTLDLSAAVSRYAFDDPSGVFGRLAYDLGNVYRAVGFEPANDSTLFNIMQMSFDKVQGFKETIPAEKFRQTLEAIESAIAPLPKTASARADANLLRQEFEYAAAMLRHAGWRALLAIGAPVKDAAALRTDLEGLIETHQKIWLARNRPGGLPDSLARLERLRKDYV